MQSLQVSGWTGVPCARGFDYGDLDRVEGSAGLRDAVGSEVNLVEVLCPATRRPREGVDRFARLEEVVTAREVHGIEERASFRADLL
jgi:hypothetical protein